MSGSGPVRLQDRDRCSICLCLKMEPVTLPCGHEVCRKCFHDIELLSNLTCPFCRKRLSNWSRKFSRLKQLVDEKRWQEIQSLYPDLVKRALAAAAQSDDAEKENKPVSGQQDDAEKENEQDDELEYETQCDQIMRDMAAPGEIKKEFEDLLARDQEIRRRERDKEEEMSMNFIRTKYKVDTERITRRRQVEQDDAALARQLQRRLDQEEEETKRKAEIPVARRTRLKRTHLQTVPNPAGGDVIEAGGLCAGRLSSSSFCVTEHCYSKNTVTE